MDERGPVSRDEPRRTDMFIRRLSVKVAVALLSAPLLYRTSQAKRLSLTIPVASLLFSPRPLPLSRWATEKGSLNGK